MNGECIDGCRYSRTVIDARSMTAEKEEITGVNMMGTQIDNDGDDNGTSESAFFT